MRSGRGRPAWYGFTLIELMVTVAVVSILAVIAYPSYANYVRKGRRSDAKQALLSAAQSLERFYTERSTYAGATLGSGGVYAASSPNGFYTLSLLSQSADGFVLQAQPAGVQAGDECGSFTYDQAGTKGVSGGSLPAGSCW